MFIIKNELIYSQMFIQALRNLGNMELETTVSYRVKKWMKELMRRSEEDRPFVMDMDNRYFEKDDKDQWVPQKNDKGEPVPGSRCWKEGKSEKGYKEEQKKFYDIDVELWGEKLKLAELPPKIRPNILFDLDPVIDGDDAEAEKKPKPILKQA